MFIPIYIECVNCSAMSGFLWPHRLSRLLYPWDFPGKNTRVSCHSLLQGIFLTHGSNPSLLHCRQILYHLSHQGSQFILKTFKTTSKVICDLFSFCIYKCIWYKASWNLELFVCRKSGVPGNKRIGLPLESRKAPDIWRSMILRPPIHFQIWTYANIKNRKKWKEFRVH